MTALFAPGLVWLASYPKSGNTWMRILLANLQVDGPVPQDINDLQEATGIASGRALIEQFTVVDTDLLLADEIDALRPLVYAELAAAREDFPFVKVHDAFTRLADGTPLMGRAATGALYLVRDPRDVAVSLAYHASVDFAEAIRRLNSATHALKAGNSQVRQRLGSWSDHVQSWLQQQDTATLCLRYEDMLADTAGELRRALDFLQVQVDEPRLQRAVAHADFAQLQQQEKDKGFRERMSETALFFRSGRAGDWREHLTEAQVRQIEDCHGQTMLQLGYQLEF